MSKFAEDEYRWMMDVPLNYNSFETDMELKQKENCAYVNKKGVWKTEKCDDELPFICTKMLGGLGY